MKKLLLLMVIGLFFAQPVFAENELVFGVTKITAVKTYATANGSFSDGWKWIFDVAVPENETVIKLKFDNWTNGLNSIAAANNIRFYSAQSANANSSDNSIMINSAGEYSEVMNLFSDTDNDLNVLETGRQIQITIETRVPVGSSGGSFSTSYGINSEHDSTIPLEEGSIATSLHSSPINTKVKEGDEKVAVLGVEVKAIDSDMTVQNMEIAFTAKASDYFTYLYVFDGYTQIGFKKLDASALIKAGESYYTTFTNLNAFIKKDETKFFTVKVSADASIDSVKLDEAGQVVFNIFIPASGIKATDGFKNDYEPENNDIIKRTIIVAENAINEAKLTFSKAENTPHDRNIASGLSGDIGSLTLLVFTATATKDEILFSDLEKVVINDSGNVLDAVSLYEGSVELASGKKEENAWNFNEFKSIITEDSVKTYTLKADLSGLDTATSTISVEMDISNVNIGASNSVGDEVAVNESTLISSKVFAYDIAPEFTLSFAKFARSGTALEGTFSIKIEAVGGVIYIPKTSADAFGLIFVDADEFEDDVTTVTYSKPSGVTEVGDYYVISEDDIVTFTVDGVETAGAAGTYDMRVASITWGYGDSDEVTEVASTYMSDDFKTNTITIQ